MAFIQAGMSQTGGSLTSTSVPVSWIYQQTADTLATIRASGYFNSWTNNLTQFDYMYIRGSDGADLVNVTSATGAATVTVAEFITTGDIADGSVTLPKLASGITPSHVIKFAGSFTTVGGAAIETFSVPGAVAATDLVFTQMKVLGAAPADINEAEVKVNDQIEVEFAADPSNDHVFQYQIIRAAA